MDKISINDELLNKAFRLAYFIHCDKAVAMQIATEALSKLEVACAAQDKRLYYTPTGRPSSRVARTKVSLSEPHLLQRLVYIGSESREREKEQTGQVDREDMTIHYIKHLVRITAKRNSFYVALGLSRLLHSYSTTETAQVYGLVVQDPDRVRDDYYYRSRKGGLMRELKDRFGESLNVVKAQRGEERFQTQETSMKLNELVKNCLRAFTPWNTPCVVPEGHDPFSETITPLSFNGEDPDQEHKVEVNRIHSVLHPECYERLIDALALDSPEDRLGVPYFSMSDSGNGTGGDRSHPPDLNEHEIEAVRNLMAEESARRRVAVAGLMKVMVDGEERARFDPRKRARVKFEVGSDAELLEIRTSDEKGEIVLATFLTDFESPGNRNSNKYSIRLEGGQNLSFAVLPLLDSVGEVEGATVEIGYRETNLARAALLGLNRLVYSISDAPGASTQTGNRLWKPVLAAGMLALLVGGLFFSLWLGQTLQKDGPIVKSPEQTPAPEENNAPGQPNVAQSNEPVQQTEPENKNGTHEPKPQQRQRTNIDNNRIVAVSPPDRDINPRGLNPNRSIVRSPRRSVPGTPLPEVTRIRVEVVSDQSSSRVGQIISNELNRTGRFSAVESSEEAQAALKVHATEDAKSGKGTFVVRLVNESGYVLWPAKTSGSGTKYTGSLEEVVPIIIRDLARETAKQEQDRKRPGKN